MADVIKHWNGTDVRLRSGSYWHAFLPGGLLKHNARAGNGVVSSISFLVSNGLEKAVSPFYAGRWNDKKEVFWEDVRLRAFNTLPERLRAFYCFESRELAERAIREWFAGKELFAREILELRIAETARLHRCDAQWLEVPDEQWQSSAEAYWEGKMTANPFPEVLVDGEVYFPSWQTFSFGF
ncbi:MULTISPECIES: hypothetical protein [unclassified Bradyrhizobium]|uniref:hypothetical protein n=1 Tax=unclassified Bradyrhizobium TaxID=2631580 RepID=UPI0028E36B2D|nr:MULTISPECIES: hypothetical protein [unclassified Bradyrhizobium]